MEKILNYIGGKLQEPVSRNYFDNFDPAKGEIYSLIPDSDESDIQAAVVSANAAFSDWSAMPKQKRSQILLRLADLIADNANELAMQESRDNGKPLKLAKRVDIPRAEANIRFFATAILHFESESHAMEEQAINYTLREPIGLVGTISPWNLPLYLFTWKIAPALAAGNCVIAKPSEVTPYTAFTLSKLCIEAGLPPGVLNIVHGYGHKTGEAIVQNPDIKVISFTGGTKTGARIASIAAPMFKKLSLELGGKNPNIIFDDCDFDVMLKTTLHSSFANQGQICLCGSRILIQKGIFEKFKTEFVKRVAELNVGSPLLPDVDLGAVVSKSHMEKILSHIEIAKQEGGTVLTGGEQVHLSGKYENGWFIRPTVIEGLNNTCRTNQEEIFGPVVTLQPFENEKEAFELANGTIYGLSATLWTSDLKRAHRMAHKLQAGIVWINCWLVRDLRTPFGGTKSSGVGREGGFEALRFFTEPKNICISLK
jgi:aminomuconate-semialdehyde/2-hydroxymuconate-6-semialdehyde dehydrogenase